MEMRSVFREDVGEMGARDLAAPLHESEEHGLLNRAVAPSRPSAPFWVRAVGAVCLCGVVATFAIVARGARAHGAQAPAFRAERMGAMVAEELETAPQKPPWQCASDGEDCSDMRCCANPGSSCYRKNEYWSMCNQTCTPGVQPGDEAGGNWSCEALTKPAPPSCSWEGENCHSSKCCRRAGFTCFEKHNLVGYCGNQTCESAIGSDVEPWTCRRLGGDVGGVNVLQPSERPAGTSLYCFSVVTPQGVTAPGVKEGYEQSLLELMRGKKLGIYQCDATSIFEGMRVQKGDWQSVANTDVFRHAWSEVHAKGLYRQHDWTVKADADAVFFPERLRIHLKSLAPPANTPTYLHNINFNFHFMGALEVLSAGAVDALLDNFDHCTRSFGLSGGEDFFVMQCLDAAYVGHMTDFSLLDDKYTHGEGWHLFDVSPCADPSIVAYHPYKHANAWEGCYKVAMGINKPEDFVGCENRWHGDACYLKSERKHLPTDPESSKGIVVNLRK